MNAREYYNRGLVEKEQKKHIEALSSFEQAYKKFTDPNDKAKCLYQCGVLSSERDTNSAAVRYFMQARDLFTDKVEKASCEYNRGVISQKYFEKKESAMEAYNNALLLLPPDANWSLKRDIYSAYAELYARLTVGDEILSSLSENKRKQTEERLQTAILYFNKALICWEKSPSGDLERKGALLFNRAGVYEALGQHRKAHDDYTAAYGLNPNLARDDVTTRTKLYHFVIHFPELYQLTLKKLLLPEQLRYVKEYLPKCTSEGFERVASLLPPDADGKTRLQIYLDCADGYFALGREYFSFSEEKMKNNQENYKKALRYYHLALTCAEVLENDVALKGEIFLNIANLFFRLDDDRNAHDNLTTAYQTNPKLVNTTATDGWLKSYIKNFPEFYANTFEPLLSEEQRISAERVKLEIKKSEDRKKKFQAFKTKLHLFTHSDARSEKKSEEERPDNGNYFLLSDNQPRENKFR